MKINLSQYAGFCDGVKRAYEIVMGLDMEKAKKPVFVLGSLVHNPEVMKRVEERGIEKIDRETILHSQPGEIGTLIITAHGTGPDIYQLAKEKGIEIVDTTCPKVIKVQRLAQVYAKRGYKIIIFGDEGHKEVKGINDWGNGQSFVISQEDQVSQLEFLPEDKIVILSQTTQNEETYKKISRLIKEKYSQAEDIMTTCHTTHFRQSEIKKLAKENDVMIIIGSRTSANSNRLFEISQEINQRSLFIETVKDINAKDLDKAQSVGLSAGASTPEWIIKEVLDFLAGL